MKGHPFIIINCWVVRGGSYICLSFGELALLRL